MKKILCLMVVFLFLLGAVSSINAADPKEKTQGAEKVMSGKVNINTASAEELCTLPGIDKKIADEIIAYRAKEPFKDIEDIMEVKGIGEKRYEKIKDLIVIK